MAQQKMHCGLRRTCSDIQKDADGENSSLARKSLEQDNFSASSKDCEVSSVVWRNFNHRCAILTFFALEPNGHWRIVTLPLEYPDHTFYPGSGTQVNMDGLRLVSPSPVSSLKVVRQKVQRGPTTDRNCSVKSPMARNFSGSNIQRQSRNKGFAKKGSEGNGLLVNSCQNCCISGEYPVMIPSGSHTDSPGMYANVSKEDTAIKRNSRKKVRKKGKRNKKLSVDTGLTELECAHGSSTPEFGAKKGVGLLPYATTLAVSLPEHSCNGNYSEANNNGTTNCSATSKTCPSYIDEVDASKALVPSVLHNISSEHHLSNSENGLQIEYPGFSTLNGGVQDTHCKLISCSDDPNSNVFFETKDALVLDSLSLDSNSDESCNTDYAFKLSNEERAGNDFSESPGYIAMKACSSNVDSCSHTERTNCGRQGYTSSERHSGLVGKTEKQIKRVPRNSSVYRISSVGNLHGRFGKENNHSVWQKVQRNDADQCNYELKKVNSVCSQFDIGLKEAPLLIKHNNVVDCNVLSKSENKNQTKLKISRKLKKKTSPGSKQEYHSYSRKGSHAIKACSNVCKKINMQQNEIFGPPAQMSGQKELESVPSSHFKTNCRRIGFQTKRVESITFKPVRSSQLCPSELEPLESMCNTVSILNDQTAENQSSLLSRSHNSLDSSELLEELSAVNLRTPVGNEDAKVKKEVSPAEQDTASGAILQKWIPVGVKVSGFPSSSEPTSLSMAKLDEPAAERLTLKNTAEEEVASLPHTLVSSMNARVMSTGQSSENVKGLPSDDEFQKLRNQSTCTPEEYCNNHDVMKCLIRESKDQNIVAFEKGSSKILWAVNDAHKVQLASEAIQMATGFPIAEFERLLHSASPVICPLHNIISCQTCSDDQVVGASLCRHETPNISLGSLWQWYEKHGSYGLEVRAEDYENSKRLGIDRFAFRGYFVPLLSAVQLFRICKSRPVDNSNEILGNEATETCEIDKTSENSSNIGHLAIYSALVPQPCTEDLSILPSGNHACYSEPSSVCIKDNVCVQPIDSKWSDDLELLFEYFESEQPQQRRPLYEMIKELVRGNGPSQCRAYGDPTILDSAGLHDLHPKSWYSVAWYPIYRIPDGNFRAAFLTYHSLGHLVRRGPTFDSLCVDACIVSPVVGLQSYNAQGECWLESRHSAHCQTSDIPNSNPSGILKERLRTLEQTASLMARAVVTKGSQTSVNRQPDYEFFLSRRR